MSAAVKVSGKLPGDPEINGLDAEHDDLLKDPKAVRCAVVWYQVKDANRNFLDGSETPRIEFRRFEPIGTLDEIPDVVRDLVLKRAEQRSGRTPLPFDELEPDEDADAGDSKPRLVQ